MLRVLSAVDAYALAVPLVRDNLEGHLTPATLLLPVSGGVDPFGE